MIKLIYKINIQRTVISKIINEEVKAVPDAEIYTDVFSRIENKDIEDFLYKINYHIIRNKTYDASKILGKYNLVLDGTRFQRSHHEIGKEWLKETKEGKTIWYLSMLDMKLVANQMAIPIMSEIVCQVEIEKLLKQKMK